jgi:hypothetical protein
MRAISTVNALLPPSVFALIVRPSTIGVGGIDHDVVFGGASVS